MATKKVEKTPLKKGIASFMLIGEAKINDYTFKIDEKSEKSDWVYNVLNLGVYCGETHGTVYAELMGGYGAERDNVVYVHGKKEDGTDDFENRFTIDWDDRFDDDILESIGDFCFMTVGLVKDKKEKVFYKKFLTPYDMIAYIKENLEDGTVVNVKGNLKYSIYNDETQTKKEITSVVLSKVDDGSKYCAKFTQTMLLSKDSMGKPDKDKGVIPMYAKVVDYIKEWKGKKVKQNIPYSKTFEFEVDLTNKEMVEKIVAKLLKVKKDITEVTFEGDLVEGGALVTVTEEDIPDDIRALIDMGVYTLEEALTKCTVNTGREKRMIIRKPSIKMVEGKDGTKTPVIQKFESKYTEDDLIFGFMLVEEKEDDDDNGDKAPFDTDETKDSDSSWLDNL
jgi:hypothetical protein